jgi:hypothetical protein
MPVKPANGLMTRLGCQGTVQCTEGMGRVLGTVTPGRFVCLAMAGHGTINPTASPTGPCMLGMDAAGLAELAGRGCVQPAKQVGLQHTSLARQARPAAPAGCQPVASRLPAGCQPVASRGRFSVELSAQAVDMLLQPATALVHEDCVEGAQWNRGSFLLLPCGPLVSCALHTACCPPTWLHEHWPWMQV